VYVSWQPAGLGSRRRVRPLYVVGSDEGGDDGAPGESQEREGVGVGGSEEAGSGQNDDVRDVSVAVVPAVAPSGCGPGGAGDVVVSVRTDVDAKRRRTAGPPPYERGGEHLIPP